MSKILLAISLTLFASAAVAQDVPGIEICTAEKTMERRTSCLQSNVNFLKAAMAKDALEQQKKLDSAGRDITALKGQVDALTLTVAGLRKSLEQLQTQLPAQGADKKPKDAPAKQ
jgi:hypothetical protein